MSLTIGNDKVDIVLPPIAIPEIVIDLDEIHSKLRPNE